LNLKLKEATAGAGLHKTSQTLQAEFSPSFKAVAVIGGGAEEEEQQTLKTRTALELKQGTMAIESPTLSLGGLLVEQFKELDPFVPDELPRLREVFLPDVLQFYLSLCHISLTVG